MSYLLGGGGGGAGTTGQTSIPAGIFSMPFNDADLGRSGTQVSRPAGGEVGTLDAPAGGGS